MIDNEEQAAELPLETAGSRLARARVSAGKSLADIAMVTKISERQLSAIEAGNFGALPSRAYSVGFARTYAKAVGLDSNAIVEIVRQELSQQAGGNARRTVPAFEPGDPARLPGGKVVWYAAVGLLIVLVAGLVAWPSLYSPGGSLPSILPTATPSAAPAAPAPPPQASGPVVFTATRDKVWVRFVDGNGQQLLQKELALGESWTLPESAGAVRLTSPRPDGLAVAIGGRPVPPLVANQQPVRDLPVTAAALLARGAEPITDAPVAITSSASSVRPVRRPAPARPSQAEAQVDTVPVAGGAAAAPSSGTAPAPEVATADSPR